MLCICFVCNKFLFTSIICCVCWFFVGYYVWLVYSWNRFRLMKRLHYSVWRYAFAMPFSSMHPHKGHTSCCFNRIKIGGLDTCVNENLAFLRYKLHLTKIAYIWVQRFLFLLCSLYQICSAGFIRRFFPIFW